MSTSIKPQTKTSPNLAELRFELAAGSVPGRRHVGSGNLLVGRNNQDSLSVTQGDDYLIATVHDGCGSCPSSEFGARLAAHVVPKAIAECLRTLPNERIHSAYFWLQVKRLSLGRMAAVAALCSQSSDSSEQSRFAKDHLLFTTLGALITKENTVIFGIGDGAYGINGTQTILGPYPDNAPDYLCKTLVNTTNAAEFTIHECMPTKDLQQLWLATDGIQDLIYAAAKNIPGKSRPVGTLVDLLRQDFLFSELASENPSPQLDSLTGWLRQINSESTKIVQDEYSNAILKREEGHLPDDTTLIALRRIGNMK